MIYLTCLEGNPFGQVVKRVTNAFETDAAMRRFILSWLFTSTVEPLSDWEVEEVEAGSRLRDYPSAIILREQAAGYLDLLERIVSRLRGQDQSAVHRLEDLPQDIHLLNLQSYWLAAPQFREAVEALMKKLEEIVKRFDYQVMATWLRRVYQRIQFQEIPSFLQGVNWEELSGQYQPVEDYCFNQAKLGYYSQLLSAYQVMETAQAREELRTLFLIDHNQLYQLGANRRGHKVSVDDFFPREDSTGQETEPPFPHQEIVLPSGLIVITSG